MVAPSLEALEKAVETKIITGGLAAGVREVYFDKCFIQRRDQQISQSGYFWLGIKCDGKIVLSPKPQKAPEDNARTNFI